MIRSVGRMATLVVLATLIGACGGAAGPSSSATGAQPSPPTATGSTAVASSSPTASPGAALSVVSFSDSVFGNGDDNNVAAIDQFAKLLAADRGRPTIVHGYWFGGYRSSEVLAELRTNASLRTDLAAADVIVFEVPVGEFRFLCPFDNTMWMPLPSRPATEWTTCAAKVVAENGTNAAAIMDELVKLRRPDALVRAVNLWELGHNGNIELGIEPQMQVMYRGVNASLAAAAKSHAIPVVDAWTTFMGPKGTDDPYAAGYVLDDLRHLTNKGATTLAALIHAVGETATTAAPAP